MSERIARLHTCTVCSREFEWNDEAEWFGSCIDEDEGTIKAKVCSQECKEAYLNPQPKEKV